MAAALRTGPKSIAQLADELDANPDSVKHAVARGARLFVKVLGADGVQRFGLVDRRRTE
jgi:hypothetical protein